MAEPIDEVGSRMCFINKPSLDPPTSLSIFLGARKSLETVDEGVSGKQAQGDIH